MSALALASGVAPTPLVALRVPDPLRRRQLERTLAAVPEAVADVLVLDLGPGQKMPAEVAGFEGALLVLTDDPAVAAEAGPAGVLPRMAGERQIAAAVAALAEGLTVRLPQTREGAGFAPPEPLARSLLTPRELEVLAQIAQGMSNKAVARRLGISVHTVKYHLEAIFTKLGARSRADAVSRGLRQGLLVV
jgi:DNA-binding NarL/FixJ family response regulator